MSGAHTLTRGLWRLGSQKICCPMEEPHVTTHFTAFHVFPWKLCLCTRLLKNLHDVPQILRVFLRLDIFVHVFYDFERVARLPVWLSDGPSVQPSVDIPLLWIYCHISNNVSITPCSGRPEADSLWGVGGQSSPRDKPIHSKSYEVTRKNVPHAKTSRSHRISIRI